jgi:hypothetical protein
MGHGSRYLITFQITRYLFLYTVIVEGGKTIEGVTVGLDFFEVIAHRIGIGVDDVLEMHVLRQVLQDVLQHRHMLDSMVLLCRTDYPTVAPSLDGTCVVVVYTGEHAKERSFTYAVTTDETKLFVWLNGKVQIME